MGGEALGSAAMSFLLRHKGNPPSGSLFFRSLLFGFPRVFRSKDHDHVASLNESLRSTTATSFTRVTKSSITARPISLVGDLPAAEGIENLTLFHPEGT